MFATKYSMCSICLDLQVLHTSAGVTHVEAQHAEAAAVVVAAEGRVFALGALAGAVAVAAATSLFLAAPFRRG